MILKIVFLLAYFLLVFIGTRVFELYATSLASWECINKFFPGIFTEDHVQQRQSPDIDMKKHVISSSEVNTSDIDSQIISDATSYHDNNSNNDVDDVNYHIANFKSYAEFENKISDVTNIWVVQVNMSAKEENLFSKKQWTLISKKLRKFGFKMGIYSCSIDSRFCLKHNVFSPTVILVTPREHHRKAVDFHVYQIDLRGHLDDNHKENSIYRWIQRKLTRNVKTVHSLSELIDRPSSSYRNLLMKPSMFFVYKSNQQVAPLLFSTLSVRFSGRIKFYVFKTEDKIKTGNMFAMNPSVSYKYGEKKGEYLTYSCVEFFLRTLHPEMNDIFVISVILLNMACWLELFLQKGGPLKRLLYYVWGLAIGNLILVSIWLLLIQLLYMPQIQPIIELCLKTFQYVMFTNLAAIIRQDIIQLSKHIHIVIFGFVGYGILLGYLHYKLRSERERVFFTSVMDIIRYDVEELTDLFYSFTEFITPSLRIYRFEEGIERILLRLASPDLWLHSKYPTDYMHRLPTWTYLCNDKKCLELNHMRCINEEETQSVGGHILLFSAAKHGSEFTDDDCVICLEIFMCGDTMRGLSCGHSFHKSCIDSWLFPINELSHHKCPVCRWPTDIMKGTAEVIDFT